jgi:hypothetical protein
MAKYRIEFEEKEELLQYVKCVEENRDLKSAMTDAWQTARSLIKHGAEFEQYKVDVQRIHSMLYDAANG